MQRLRFLFICFLCGVTLLIPTLTWAHSSVVMIKMTSSGFQPNEVTIDENTTLNFINDDAVEHWPASDLHPTHQIFPEFDPKKPIPKGDVWIFKPKKVGTWKFHDHLFPHFKGVLTVISESNKAMLSQTQTIATNSSTAKTFRTFWNEFWQKTLFYFFQGIQKVFGIKPTPVPSTTPAVQGISDSEFKKLPAQEQYSYLKKLAQSEGSEQAWKFIQTMYQEENGMQGNIHDLAHLAGQLLFGEKGFSGLSLCTSQFAFGCFHGFLDVAFKDSITQLPEAEKACQKLGTGTSGPVASCIHGIGHGVASFYQTEKLNDALASCEQLGEASRQYCYDGVFMEFERNASPTFYKTDNLLYPCDAVDAKYVFACGRNQPQVLLQRFKKNFTDVVTTCLVAQSPNLKSACFDALGFIAAAQGKGDAQQIVGLCQQITEPEYKNRCLKAAAGEVIFQEMPKWYEAAPQICNASDAAAQAECQGYTQHIMEDYGKVRPQGKTEDPNTYVGSQMQICLNQGGRDDCYKKVAAFLSQQLGLKKSLELLKTNENVPAVYARCHEITHYLSRNEYEKTKSVPQTYALCDSTCHGGCYHGTLEAYLKEKQISLGDSQVMNAVVTVCGKPADYSNLLVFYECLHGLGHAGMFITDMEVLKSLALCDLLESINYRERCYSGVFMENSSSSTNNDHPGKYIKTDDPLYPCNSIGEKYQQLCYRYQSSYFALITNHNWFAVAGLCLKVPLKYQQDCFRTVGTNQVGFTQDITQMKTDCEQMPEQFKSICFGGVIGSLSYRFVGDMQKMVEFCNLLASEYQLSCVKNIGSSIIDWQKDTATQQQLCDQTGRADFADWCKQGITLSQAQTGNNQVFN